MAFNNTTSTTGATTGPHTGTNAIPGGGVASGTGYNNMGEVNAHGRTGEGVSGHHVQGSGAHVAGHHVPATGEHTDPSLGRGPHSGVNTGSNAIPGGGISSGTGYNNYPEQHGTGKTGAGISDRHVPGSGAHVAGQHIPGTGEHTHVGSGNTHTGTTTGLGSSTTHSGSTGLGSNSNNVHLDKTGDTHKTAIGASAANLVKPNTSSTTHGTSHTGTGLTGTSGTGPVLDQTTGQPHNFTHSGSVAHGSGNVDKFGQPHTTSTGATTSNLTSSNTHGTHGNTGVTGTHGTTGVTGTHGATDKHGGSHATTAGAVGHNATTGSHGTHGAQGAFHGSGTVVDEKTLKEAEKLEAKGHRQEKIGNMLHMPSMAAKGEAKVEQAHQLEAQAGANPNVVGGTHTGTTGTTGHKAL